MKKRTVILTAAVMGLMTAQTAFAAGWRQNATGWWYATNDSGSTWYSSGWQWIDGNGDGIAECYYFDANGYMLAATTTPDGYTVNANGAWTSNGSVQTKSSTKNYVSAGSNVNGTGSGNGSISGGSSVYTTSGSSGSGNSSSSSGGSSSGSYSTSADSSQSSTGTTTTKTAGLNYEMAMECFDLINEQREANGLDALEFDDDIYAACEVRAAELPVYFEHERPDGSMCFTALAEVGAEYSAAAENIAAGQSTAAKAVTSWMNSSGHRKNILTAKYNRAAIGCIYDPDSKYKYYWVQLFTD